MENRQVFFFTRTLFWGFGLSLILNMAGTSFWISEVLGLIVGLIILLFVKKVNTSKLVRTLSGFSIALLATMILVNMGGTLYLRDTPNWLLGIVPILAGLIIGASRKESLKRTLLVLFIYAFFIYLSGTIILSMNAKPDNLLPFTPEFGGILKGAAIFTLTSITPVLSLGDIEDKKSLIGFYLVGAATIILTSLLTILVLGSKEAMLYRYPEYILLKRIKIYDFFTNVDNLFVIPMVVDFIITIAYGFRNIEIWGKTGKIIFPLLMLIISVIFCSSSKLMTLLYWYFPYILAVLLILTLIPKKRQNKSRKN